MRRIGIALQVFNFWRHSIVRDFQMKYLAHVAAIESTGARLYLFCFQFTAGTCLHCLTSLEVKGNITTFCLQGNNSCAIVSVMADRTVRTSSSIRLSKDDKNRLRWLRKDFGGLGQSAVVTIALSELYARRKALQKAPEPTKEEAPIGDTQAP